MSTSTSRGNGLTTAKRQLLKAMLRDQAGAHSATPAATAHSEGGHYALSFAQERLWVLDQLRPGNPVYHIPTVMRLRGQLDAVPLERSLREIARRHAVLRSHFSYAEHGGQPVQTVRPAEHFSVPLDDLSQLPDDRREAVAFARVEAERNHPFELARQYPFRARLLRLSNEDHILVLVMHHIAYDGWSGTIFQRELFELYGAYSAGLPSPLPELPVQYTDFARWQRDRMESGVWERELTYWRETLADYPGVMELPADRQRPPVQTFRGARETLVIPGPTAKALKAWGRQAGATPFMTLLALFKVLLFRLTGQEDTAVGAPAAQRPYVQAETLIGCFLNTLVLRTRLHAELSLTDVLHRVVETTLGAYDNGEVPFEKIVEMLKPERDPSRSPLVQIMFNMVSFGEVRPSLPGVRVEVLGNPEAGAKFDLTVYAAESDDELHLHWVFNADLFSRERMREMLRQYELLVTSALTDAEQPIAAASLVTHAAIKVVPDPAEPLDASWCGGIHQYPAQAPSNKVAVSCATESWTYGELEEWSNRLAHALIAKGIQKGDVVAIYAHRSAALVWAILGILKAGGAYLILDPAYPPLRLSEMVGQAGPRGLIVLQAAGPLPEGLAEAIGRTVVCRFILPRRAEAIAARFLSEQPASAPDVLIGPDDLAVVTFTSGSTGLPKGVLGRHGPLTHFYPWMARRFGFTSSGRFSMLSGLSHDPLQRDIFTSLYLNATLHIPDPDQMYSPGWLAWWLREEGITTANLTPAMLQVLTTGIEAGRGPIDSLQHAFVIGEMLTRRDVRRLRQLAPCVTWINLYGATETQRALSYFGMDDAEDWEKEVLPLGRGMQDAQLLIINTHGQLAGVGELGEICIRSPHLARGYLSDEVLTQQRFLTNPFTGDPADRIYRTGDLGRYTISGIVEPAGRADMQVKIRGFRIELGEIQSALGEYPRVRDAVVIHRAMPGGENQLVAYVVCGQTGATISQLFQFLRQRLPGYMVPSVIMFLEALPLTPSGKLDHRALPEPHMARPDLDSAFVAPRTATEELVAALWADALGLKQVGVNDNFFELGGHSLMATRIVAHLRGAFGVEMPLAALFEHATVSGLAAQVEAASRAAVGSELPPFRPAERNGELPLSFAQQRLWILDQLEPGSPSYNMHWGLRLSGALRIEALQISLNEIVRRHEVLRTTFQFSERLQAPVQVVGPVRAAQMRVVDVSGATDSEAELRRLASEDAERAFDLETGPLLRTTLVRLDETEHALLISMHHIISDGWSAGILNRELTVLYEALAAERLSPLPELPVQYGDFSVWQRQWLQGDALEAQLSYWREKLAGLSAIDVPADRPRPAKRNWKGKRQRLSLPHELSDGLKAICRQEHATMYMVLLAAFQALLHRYTGQTDIAVGSPIANRTREEMAPLIGMFVNTLVLRANLAGGPTFRNLLRQVRESALGSYAHQDVPFEMLVDELQPQRDLSRTPLFQVLFVLQNAPWRGEPLPGLSVQGVEVEVGAVKFDLTLGMFEDADGLSGYIEYSTELFDDSTIQRMAAHWQTLLAGVVSAPEQRVSALPLLTPDDVAQVAAWNRTERTYPTARCLHEMFTAQAERTPDALAIENEHQQMTYRELNERANRLAHHLQRLGVGPEVAVGICTERAVEMVVGLLGVLKAGGAYVPLDPEHPRERLAYMLETTQVPVVLTQERLLPALPGNGAKLICLDAGWEEISRESSDNPESGAGPDNLAYVIFTSGSTGRPKGAMVQHRAIYNRLTWMQEAYQLTGEDRVLQKTPFSFDVSVWEFFWTLLSGATLVMARPGGHRDGRYLKDLIINAGVTTIHFVPSMLQAFLEEQGVDECRTLRRVVCSGEELTHELQERFFARMGRTDVALHNLYGPTEAAVDVSFWQCRAGDARRRVPIGRPIPNTQLHVLDENMRLVPVGVPGELFIGGMNVGRGYFNRPDLTAERFVPDPFAGCPGARLYRTGDLVRRLPDGTIDFLGRIDNQVKIRGNRVELGEIEAVAREHPGVRDVVVVSREDSPGEKRLVAYVVPATPEVPTIDQLRMHMRNGLPAYMVPHVYVILDALPLSANGKVDRRTLAAPGPSRPELDAPYVPPHGPLQEVICAIWAAVLRIDRVGVMDNFFALGGDSMRAVRAAAQLRGHGYQIALEHLFLYQTVADLSRHMAELESAPVVEETSAAFDLVSAEDLQLLEDLFDDDGPMDKGGIED